MGKSTVDASAGFGLRDKLAYAAGDFGCNMSFALKGYLTIYWTQFMGIDNYLMASLLLIVQIWDAINDPIIGAMVDADTHKYRRNKFLAYIWFGAIGLTVAGALCYLPFPQAPGMVKNILFVAGYMIWDAFYTVANVPYGSMLSLISDDPIQRAQLSTFRSIGSMGGGLLTGMLIPVIIYDNQNNLRGEQMFVIALIMGLIGLVCFRFMVTNTKVRVDTTITLKEDAPKFNVMKAFNNFIHNRPAVGATLAPIATFIGMYGASTAGQILFQAYFKNAKISGLVGMISYFGVFHFQSFCEPYRQALWQEGSRDLWFSSLCAGLRPDAGSAHHTGRPGPQPLCPVSDHCNAGRRCRKLPELVSDGGCDRLQRVEIWRARRRHYLCTALLLP